jgi:hypothetical protein
MRFEWLAVALSGVLCAGVAHAAGDPSLLGCWRNLDSLSYSDDGRAARVRLPCTLKVSRYRMVSICERPWGEQRIDYAYRIVRPGVYEDTVLEHSALAQAFFTRRESAYTVVGNLLFTTIYPQSTAPYHSSNSGRLDTVSVRATPPWRCGS